MKKFDLRKIMRDAWRMYRNSGHRKTFSTCLKQSWAAAKSRLEQVANDTKVGPGFKFVDGMTIIAEGVKRTLNRWTKNGHDRVYINGGSRTGDGFIDLKRRSANLHGDLIYQVKIAKMVLAMEF